MFPGYVLIHMIMNDDTWYVVRNTRGVTGFVGPGSKPVPLSDEEMESLRIRKDRSRCWICSWRYHCGNRPVHGRTRSVPLSLSMRKHTLTINVEMFGRETPVELNFTEVKHM